MRLHKKKYPDLFFLADQSKFAEFLNESFIGMGGYASNMDNSLEFISENERTYCTFRCIQQFRPIYEMSPLQIDFVTNSFANSALRMKPLERVFTIRDKIGILQIKNYSILYLIQGVWDEVETSMIIYNNNIDYDPVFINRVQIISDKDHEIYSDLVEGKYSFLKGCKYKERHICTNRKGEKINNLSIRDIVNLVHNILYIKEYGKVEERVVNRDTKKVIKCSEGKVISHFPFDISVLDSHWLNTIIRTNPFGVRGHFRHQPTKNGPKLIWINEYQKKGYKRLAGKLKGGNP